MSPHDALTLLERVTSLPEHKFWPADLALSEAIAKLEPIIGHRQVTDAYLLALARSRHGILATLDRGALALAGAKEQAVELLRDL